MRAWIVWAVALPACAPKLAGVRGDGTGIAAEIRHARRAPYTLATADGEPLAQATPRGGIVTFELPADGPSHECLMIVDPHQRALSLGSRSAFYAPAWAEASDAQWRADKAAGAVEQFEFVRRKAVSIAADSESKLAASPAYRGGQCVTPPVGQVPTMPALACAPSSSDDYGTAMCLALAGGPEACSWAADEIGRAVDVEVANFLSSPACGALVAQLMGQRYEFEDFLGDVALGLGEDVAQSLLAEDDPWSNLAGLFVGAAVVGAQIEQFNECQAAAAERCTWRADRRSSSWRSAATRRSGCG